MNVKCPKCQKLLSVKATNQNQVVKCQCGQRLTVKAKPTANAPKKTGADAPAYTVSKSMLGKQTVKFRCSQCEEPLSDDLGNAGNPDQCPRCGSQFVTPGIKEKRLHEAEQKKLEAERQLKKKQKEEAKQGTASQDSVSIPEAPGNPSLTTCPECSAQVSKKAESCPKCGFALIEPQSVQGGFPAFDTGPQMPMTPPSFTQSTTPYHAAAKRPQPSQDEDENLKSGKGWLLAPWRAEDGGIRYWSLKKYLAISKFLASITFGLLAYVPLVVMIVGLVFGLFGALSAGSDGANALGTSMIGYIAVFIGAVVTYVIWFFLCHLIYIGLMAFVDLLRCFIDIEKNTR